MYKQRKKSSTEILTFLLFAIVAMLIFHYSRLDIKVASLYYNPTLQWVYRDNFWLENVLHKGGVWITALILIWIIYQIVIAYFSKDKKNNQIIYYSLVLISSLLTILIISLLKNHTTFPCPWYVNFFGGAQSIPDLMKLFSPSLPVGHCFPAGHSSGGYCFLSFYFIYFLLTGKRDQRKLLPALMLGLIFGITQQMRGAHFLSHDLATLAVSIFIPWVTTHIYFYYNKVL